MPHIRLPLLADELRRTRGRSPELPDRNQQTHGRFLIRQLSGAKRQLARMRAARPEGAPPIPAGIQILIKGARSESGKVLLEGAKLKGLKLEVIEERRDGLFVAVSPDPQAERLEETLQWYRTDMRTPSGRRKRGVRSIFQVEEIEESSRTLKMGDELALIEIRDDRPYIVDVELAAGIEVQTGDARRREFANYIQQGGGDPIGAGPLVEEDYALFRVRIAGRVVKELLDIHPWVISVDLPPIVEREGYDLRDIREPDLPRFNQPSEEAPVVTALDGGIVPRQPLIQVSVEGLEHQSFLPGNDSILDGGAEGHGTAIVSVIGLYSLRQTLLGNNQATTPVRVVVARVLDDQSEIPENLNLKQVIPDAANRMRDTCHSKIVNHSIASRAPFNRGRMSVWAETLDRLAYDDGGEGFLIISAAGNIDGTITPTLGQVSHWLNQPGFPRYLLDERCRLRNPGQAINVLTVGSYVPVAGLPFHARQALGYQNIANASQPSPFTRTGFGYLNEVKPEVVEEGGNWYQDGAGRLVRQPMITDVAVGNSQFAETGRLVKFITGTSFAAAKVSSLAARLLAILPEASVDLLRAFIVNCAIWPTRVGTTEDTLRVFGYGVPENDRALLPGESRSLLYVDGSIRIGHVHFFRIPFPTELFADSPDTVIRVSVTLAYRAPVRKSNLKYRGTILEWKFSKRDEVFEQFRRRCAAVQGNENEDAEEDVVEEEPLGDWDWAVRARQRTRGTVQKDWFEARSSEFTEEMFLAVIGRRGWIARDRQEAGFGQRYAVAISVEALGTAIPLHERIQERVRVGIPV